MNVLRQVMILALPFTLAACNPGEASAEKGTESEVKAVAAVEATETTVIESEVTADTTGTMTAFDKEKIKSRFEKVGVSVLNIVPASIDGLLEVETSGGTVFASPDGSQFIAGTLYALDQDGNYVDVLAERQAPINAEKIEKFADQMIVYPAENEKYAITVFTDITCAYCVRLHRQMSGYNELGITVRYLAYPRQGPTGNVATDMARIWCAEDPADAMTQSKLNHGFNEEVDNLEQCSAKVFEQYSLGRDLGITGTPAVFLPNGKLVAGYMPPAGMFQRIEQEMSK